MRAYHAKERALLLSLPVPSRLESPDWLWGFSDITLPIGGYQHHGRLVTIRWAFRNQHELSRSTSARQ